MQHPLLRVVILLMAMAAARSSAGESPRSSKTPTKSGATSKPSEADDAGGIVRVAPQEVGDANADFWGTLSEDDQAGAVRDLKSFGAKAADQLKHPLRPHESKFFLICSDLPDNEVGRYSLLLERMYGKLATLFGIDKSRNVWRGKALVFLFARVEDYRLYERLIEDSDPGGSFGMTHCFGDGMVHIAFYRSPIEAQFNHLLVHESVHGFLHRYRSPGRVPSWVNEGLADALASELVPNPRRAKFVVGLAKAGLEQHQNSVGDFFAARHIDGWQYPVAETLCDTMLRQNRHGYLNFIDGIKDGQDWKESLKKNLDTTPQKLLSEYGKSIGVKSLR